MDLLAHRVSSADTRMTETRRSRPRAAGGLHARAVARAACVALVLAACGGERSGGAPPTAPPTAPPPEPPKTQRPASLTIVSSVPSPDTVLAAAPPLVVRVLGPGGVPATGVAVRFESAVPIGSNPPLMWVCRVEATPCAPRALVVDTVDARGEASVAVRHGTAARSSAVIVSVPELGLRDSVTYTVRPGAATRVTLTVRDTTLYAGGRYRAVATAFDTYSNPSPQAVSFRTRRGVASVSETGEVLAEAVGEDVVVASAGALADSAIVHVPPRATIAASRAGTAIVVMELDGSVVRQVASVPGTVPVGSVVLPRWSPDGSTIVFELRRDFGATMQLVDASGANLREALPPGFPSVGFSGWLTCPSFSADGRELFSATDQALTYQAWRIRLDASAAGAAAAPGGFRARARPVPRPVARRDARGLSVPDQREDRDRRAGG
jgi:hypothetical protein